MTVIEKICIKRLLVLNLDERTQIQTTFEKKLNQEKSQRATWSHFRKTWFTNLKNK